MVNKCVIFGCKSGYDNQHEKVSTFSFPFNRPDLLEKWVKFVNRPNWKPSKSSVVCVKHFKNKLIIHGQRKKLKWELQPVPTVHSNKALKRPSTLPIMALPRKLPKPRVFQNDKLKQFQNKDVIQSFDDLCLKTAPAGYQCRKTNNFLIYYNTVFLKKVVFLQ